MRAPRTAAPRNPVRRNAVPPAQPAISKQAEELMELAVEAAQSRHLPDFLEQFALRATRMLDAIWGGVAVYRGRETELYAAKGRSGKTSSRCEEWLIANARESRHEVEARAVPKEIAATLEGAEEQAAAVFVRIAGSDNDRLGTLCLMRKRKSLDGDEKRLLHALASHAALASHLGVPPVALVGEAMSSLRQIAETGSELPCPFCRDTQRTREEYVAASAERIFLVSTSRAPGVSDDDTRTIHVLKDITDRREAERKYRELFDSIQKDYFSRRRMEDFLT